MNHCPYIHKYANGATSDCRLQSTAPPMAVYGETYGKCTLFSFVLCSFPGLIQALSRLGNASRCFSSTLIQSGYTQSTNTRGVGCFEMRCSDTTLEIFLVCSLPPCALGKLIMDG